MNLRFSGHVAVDQCAMYSASSRLELAPSEPTHSGYGGGRVAGDSLDGSVRWSNLPHRREDGVLVPNAHVE